MNENQFDAVLGMLGVIAEEMSYIREELNILRLGYYAANHLELDTDDVADLDDGDTSGHA